MTTCMLIVHALSPLHAGTGQSAGIIDLPIAREPATGLPYLPGSSLKGVLRDAANEAQANTLFGTPEGSGLVLLSDQRLLLLPIRSLYGTFAWVTAPYVLQRFARDAKALGLNPPSVPTTLTIDQCAVTDTSALQQGNVVYLEDLALTAAANTTDWGRWLAPELFPGDADWQTMFQQRLCIVSDDVFSFLLTTATEITARIRLQDDTKTVVPGGLWYEEALPAESILAGMVLIERRAKDHPEVIRQLRQLSSGLVQLGGNATVGRGLCQLHVCEGAAHAHA